jgi:hypothetical protein
MATNTTVQTHATPFTAQVVNNLQQNNPGAAPAFLQVPSDIIIHRLLPWIGTANNYNASESEKKVEAAKNLVAFGRVAVLPHLGTHTEDADQVIKQGAEKAQIRYYRILLHV